MFYILEKLKGNLLMLKEEKNEIGIMNNELIFEKSQLEEKYKKLLKEKEENKNDSEIKK